MPATPPEANPVLLGWYDLELRDAQNRVLWSATYPSRSLLKNFLQMFMGFTNTRVMISNWRVKDNTGAYRYAANTLLNQGNLYNTGLRLGWGTGSTPVAPGDYNVETFLITDRDYDDAEDLSAGQVTELAFHWHFTNPSVPGLFVREHAIRAAVTWGTDFRSIFFVREVYPANVYIDVGQTVYVVQHLKTVA